MNFNDYYARIYASWLGKLIGIRLGAPIENWLGKDVRKMYHPIKEYTVDYGQFAADDDANGPLFFVGVMEDKDLDTVTVQDMQEHLLNVVPDHNGFFWWGGKGISTEETAWQNLMDGIDAPESGSIRKNGKAIAEQIGGQIFSDCWGYITLGHVKDAVRLASMMASVTHDGDGIEGAKFVAACIALAWKENDIETIILKAKTYLNKKSRYYALIEEIYDFYKNNNDSDACLAYIEEKHSYENYDGACHILPNTAIMLYGMLYGHNDFDETMRLIAEAGRDTDCNLGNVGSIMGMMLGLDGINEKWITPFNDSLLSSSSYGFKNISTISGTARYFTEIGYRLYHKNLPTNEKAEEGIIKAYFDLPYATNGFYVDANRYKAVSLRTDHDRLKINIDSLQPKTRFKVAKKTYFNSEDVYDVRYNPQFTPQIETGDFIYFKVSNPEKLNITGKFEFAFNDGTKSSNTISFDKELNTTIYFPNRSKLIKEIRFVFYAKEKIDRGCLYLDEFSITKNPDVSIDMTKLKEEDWGIAFDGSHVWGVKGIDIYKGKVWEIDEEDGLILGDHSAFNVSGDVLAKTFETTIDYDADTNLTIAYGWKGCFSYYGIIITKKEILYVEKYDHKHEKLLILGKHELLENDTTRIVVDLQEQTITLEQDYYTNTYTCKTMDIRRGAFAFINDSDAFVDIKEIGYEGVENEKHFD